MSDAMHHRADPSYGTTLVAIRPNSAGREQAETERNRRLYDQQQVLLQDMSHRIKNILAVVQSIASQTLRAAPDPGHFTEAFTGRIASLAASHGLFSDTMGGRVDLRRIIEAQLEILVGDPPGRLDIDGVGVVLDAERATRLGLVLHELGVNATKYGALANADGHIVIRWAIRDGTMRFTWREFGGPVVVAPGGRRGFGSRLIDMSVRDVERHYDPDGFGVSFTLDLSNSTA